MWKSVDFWISLFPFLSPCMSCLVVNWMKTRFSLLSSFSRNLAAYLGLFQPHGTLAFQQWPTLQCLAPVLWIHPFPSPYQPLTRLPSGTTLLNANDKKHQIIDSTRKSLPSPNRRISRQYRLCPVAFLVASWTQMWMKPTVVNLWLRQIYYDGISFCGGRRNRARNFTKQCNDLSH